MKENMIEISGTKYYLDIDAIIKWCLSPSNSTIKESEINEGYDSDEDGIHLVSKVVRELKTNNVQDDTIRYDFVKLLLSPIFNGDFEINNSGFSYKLLFNTLIKMNFLIKIID